MPRVVTPIAGVDLTEIYAAINITTNPEIPGFPFTLGTQVTCSDGSIYVFAKAGGSITQYDTVVIDKDHAAVISAVGGATATNVHHKHGFRQGAAMTSGQAGWFMLHGAPLLRVGDNCAANVQLYTTATAGVLDDAVSSGSQYPIRGVFLASAATSGGAGSVVSGVQGHASFPHTAPATTI